VAASCHDGCSAKDHPTLAEDDPVMTEPLANRILRKCGDACDRIDLWLQSWPIVGTILLTLLVAFGLLLMRFGA